MIVTFVNLYARKEIRDFEYVEVTSILINPRNRTKMAKSIVSRVN